MGSTVALEAKEKGDITIGIDAEMLIISEFASIFSQQVKALIAMVISSAFRVNKVLIM